MRKLLSYSDNTPYANSIKNEQSQNTQKANAHENQQKYLLRDVKNQIELWDEWGNWSTCSVTCGNGRQVRWRHCSAEDCTKGLKKAQIKACHLKNCDSKTILHWLGIKTR
ncbi:unnamed protein product [Xylocopa violacea]|uniref:Uncharacterized protein n=1 Tax=Xylocopa violacea TaxID=135666 RepID=A0ABP1NWQ7_XYLVO